MSAKNGGQGLLRMAAPGTREDALYARALPPWRASVRRVLLALTRVESEQIARSQVLVQSRFLDIWFRASAHLGTATFFVASIPLLFFAGYSEAGRGLLHVLAWGGYLSSLFKDLFCVPRPFSPPVKRLTTASHHLEYGFPSTHSTNSISAALYLHTLASHHQFPHLAALDVLLVFYAGSVILGRVYCGMHTITDCAAGASLGFITWAAQHAYGSAFEEWVVRPGFAVPVSTLFIWLALLFFHPHTPDPCLCFDDAIASLSALAGTTIGRWVFATSMPLATHRPWTTAVVHAVFGIGVLVLWRIVAKRALRSSSASPPSIVGALTAPTFTHHQVFVKMVVYFGVGFIASEVLPALFRASLSA